MCIHVQTFWTSPSKTMGINMVLNSLIVNEKDWLASDILVHAKGSVGLRSGLWTFMTHVLMNFALCTGAQNRKRYCYPHIPDSSVRLSIGY